MLYSSSDNHIVKKRNCKINASSREHRNAAEKIVLSRTSISEVTSD